MKAKTLCIAEWQNFSVSDIKEALGDESKEELAQKIFKEFVKFAQGENNHNFLKFKNPKVLKAQNYVGTIQTKSGFCLEILPKTFDKEGFEKNHQCNEECEKAYKFDSEICKLTQAKSVLINCLKTLKNSPFKQIHNTNVKTMNFPLLEIFAQIFLNELENLVKKGIRKNYITYEENRNFLKGKLLFNENLKYNFAHKERFYTAFDEFSINIAPNRLIVSTLNFIKKQNFSEKTKEKLNQLLFIFEDIPPSYNIKSDFDKCHQSRYFSAYKLILQWCEIFLNHKAFTPYSGDSMSFALLFSMEKLFESFVAHHIKKNVKDCQIKIQDRSKYLIKKTLFQLKPDIVIYQSKEKKSQKIIIADTKWKIPNFENDERKYGVSQGDLYQMFSYASKYEAKEVILIYPLCERTKALKEKWQNGESWKFKADEGISLRLAFFPIYSS